MKRVWQNAKAHSPKPMTILAALFHSQGEVEKMDIRLKVSREEKNLALFLVKYRQELHKNNDEPDSLKPFTDFIIDVSLIHEYPQCTYRGRRDYPAPCIVLFVSKSTQWFPPAKLLSYFKM